MLYPWQTDPWQQISARIASNNMPHGVMICGPSGIGKYHFATRLAQLLLCQKSLVADQPCNTCSGCQWFAADSHPDLFRVEPTEGKSSIAISQIRELVERLSQTSNAGGYQVVVLHPAEKMTSAAANALLKTLEEPPGPVVLLLVTNQPSAMPATILSRCQMIKMVTPSLAQAQTWLRDQLDDPTRTQSLLAFADGLPLMAQQMATEDFSVVDQLLRFDNPLEIAAKWHKEHPERIVQVLISLTQDLVRLKATGDIQRCHHQQYLGVLQQIAHKWPLLALFEFLDGLQQDLNLLRRQSNPNVQLLLEKNLLEWCA